jgi:transposase
MTPRKPYRSDLTDAQWQRIKRLLPKAKITGRPRCDEREVINGILYVLWTGCRWEDLPHDIGASGTTCNRRLLDYQRRRVWQKIVKDLLKEADRRAKLNLRNCYHDASLVESKKGRTPKSAIQESTG